MEPRHVGKERASGHWSFKSQEENKAMTYTEEAEKNTKTLDAGARINSWKRL